MIHKEHLRQNEQRQLKSKVLCTCEKYYRIKIAYRYEEKGRGVVILNRKNYIEKCGNIFNIENFSKYLKKTSQKCLKIKYKGY